MKYAWATKGAKAVSMSGVWYDGNVPSKGPAKGEVVTLSSDAFAHISGGIAIVVDEYPGVAFEIDDFRPLISQADDIAMFKAIVERHPQIAQNSIHVSSPEHA